MVSKTKSKTPSKEVAAKPPEADDGAKLQEVIESLREHASTTATVQLVYIIIRTAWLVLIPQALGAPQFVPLAMEVLAAEIVLFLLFRAGGGFGSASQERPWVLQLYSLLSVGILGKCTTDCYVYQFAPSMWRHFRPGQPWGVPTVVALRLAPLLGIQGQAIQSALRIMELSFDAFCLLAIFRGIRTGKALVQARRQQKKALQQKKKE
ncbi:hypothetical protein ABPG77_010697 [Micractinium sp. CCAP 211/92]